MSPDVQRLAESIRMSIDLEKKGRAFYLESAAKSVNETGKVIFTRLADEEALHLLTFERMLDSSENFSNWREWVKTYPQHPPIPLFENNPAKSSKKATADELQALRIAMRQESEAMHYYGSIAEMAEDEGVRKIFDFVRQQEVYHYDLLQAEYDAITQSGFWFDTPEFRMDGKF